MMEQVRSAAGERCAQAGKRGGGAAARAGDRRGAGARPGLHLGDALSQWR